MSILTWPGSWLDRLLGRERRPAPRPEPGAGTADAAAADARYGGDEDPAAAWVTVFDAPGLEVAHVVRARLEAEGLPVSLRYDTLTVVYGMTAGFNVAVQVPRALRDRALDILADVQPLEPDADAWDGEAGTDDAASDADG